MGLLLTVGTPQGIMIVEDTVNVRGRGHQATIMITMAAGKHCKLYAVLMWTPNYFPSNKVILIIQYMNWRAGSLRASSLAGLPGGGGLRRRESLRLCPMNLNICVQKVDAKCWLADSIRWWRTISFHACDFLNTVKQQWQTVMIPSVKPARIFRLFWMSSWGFDVLIQNRRSSNSLARNLAYGPVDCSANDKTVPSRHFLPDEMNIFTDEQDFQTFNDILQHL